MKRVSAYLLILLMTFQSLVVTADTHQLHQTGKEHIEVDYNHSHAHNDMRNLNSHDAVSVMSSASGDTVVDADSASHAFNFDCHHCCHCHGVIHFFISGDHCELASTQDVASLQCYHFSVFSYHSSPDNPPPIA